MVGDRQLSTAYRVPLIPVFRTPGHMLELKIQKSPIGHASVLVINGIYGDYNNILCQICTLL